MIAAHRGPLLRVLLPLYCVAALVFLTADRTLMSSLWFGAPETWPGAGRIFSTIALVFLLYLIALLGQLVLAVIWHRIVLVPDSFLPGMDVILSYVWSAAKLGILLFLLTYLPAFVLGWLGMNFTRSFQTGFSLSLAIWLGFSLLGSWLWLRMGLVLPDAALGRHDLTITESMALTGERQGAVLVIAIVQLVLVVGPGLIDGYGWGASGHASTLVLVLLWPLGPLVGLAALTVMYRDAMADGERAA